MKTGTPKFTGLAVASLNVDFLKPSAEVEAQIGFVDPRTGATYGWTKLRQWSQATATKLRELRESMEQDAAALLFDGASVAPEVAIQATSQKAPSGFGEPPPGLGDHLGTGNVEDVMEADSL